MIEGRFWALLELVACRDMQFAEIVGAVIGQRVALEPGPQILDRIEVRRIGQQECDLDVPTQRIEIVHAPDDCGAPLTRPRSPTAVASDGP